MALDVWLQFLLLAFVVIVVPGPSMMNQLRIGLDHDLKTGVVAAFGGIMASNLYLLLSFYAYVGAMSVEGSIHYIHAVKVIGSVYILALGTRTLCNVTAKWTSVDNVGKVFNLSSAYKQGFLIGASNPKDIFFWLAIMPSFIVEKTVAELAIFSTTWSILDVFLMSLTTALAFKFSKRYKDYNFYATGIAGILLICIGAYGLFSTINAEALL